MSYVSLQPAELLRHGILARVAVVQQRFKCIRGGLGDRWAGLCRGTEPRLAWPVTEEVGWYYPLDVMFLFLLYV
jgi:hypothetical protein